ncbi:leucine-rich repeat-containing protein 42 [Lissotriton helveticus]
MSCDFRSEVPPLDHGPIYVRENGRLHLVNDPSDKSGSAVQKPRSGLRLFSKGFSVELCLKKEDGHARQRTDHFIFTYTKEGSLRYTAKPLFNLVLAFISDNVHHVDSLLDFPEQIAETLFSAAEGRQKFVEPVTGLGALQKFTEAYGNKVLSSLCLRNRHLVVSEKLEEIQSFRKLTCLDLSFCKLGDGHELLEHLTTEAMSSLVQLYLKDNGLSDAGIRKMTAPVRVLKRGLQELAILDVSCNPDLTDKGAAFLLCFKKLNCLDISNSGVKDRKAVIQRFTDQSGLVLSEDPLKEFDHATCNTQGWAEQVVRQWDQAISEAVKPKNTLKFRRAAQNFYGRPKQHNSEGPPEHLFIDIGMCGRLQFHRKVSKPDQTSETAKELPVIQDATKNKNKKRTLDTDSKEDDCTSILTKRKCAAHFTLEDWDLINTY